MRRSATFHQRALAALALSCLTAAWFGCAEAETPPGDTSSSTGASDAGAGGSGGGLVNPEGGGGMGEVCTSTVKTAEATTLDIIFLLDWSQGMQGESWSGTSSALQTFFEDPVSDGINAGMVFMPTVKPFGDTCDTNLYKSLDVPIAELPGNSFALTNGMPANALGGSTPLYAALSGALAAATAYQDAHPTHKVILVMTGDGGGAGGGANTCGHYIDEIAPFAKSALDYNGVRTYVIAVESAVNSVELMQNLDKIAEMGGTTVYDAQDISEFSEKMAEIRAAALGCDFQIPEPPVGEQLEPDKVNFTYTPGGTDSPITLPRADDLNDCGGQPGWYYDNNQFPTKIIVCPASCTTIQNDSLAEVAVAFGCASVAN